MIFMVLLLLFVPLVYGISSTPEAAGPGTGGGVNILPITPPPLFGRNVDLIESPPPPYCKLPPPECNQGPPGVFGQQPAAIVPLTPVLTPEPTPNLPVPMFGSTQQQATPTPPQQFGQMAPETQVLPPLADDSAFPDEGEVLEQPDIEEQEEEPEQPPVDEGSEDTN